MCRSSEKHTKNLWPTNLSDEEFAALLKRVKAANPQFVQGLAALVQRVGQEITEKAEKHEVQH
jgi:hypothetical protein